MAEDSQAVVDAFRLGWYVADVRGRNRPLGPPGASEGMPDRQGHALPLRVERTPTEQRIESQGVLASLAQGLGLADFVDPDDPAAFGAALDAKAHLLANTLAPKGMESLAALRVKVLVALDLRKPNPPEERPSAESIRAELETATAAQQQVVDRRNQSLGDAQQRAQKAETARAAAQQAVEKAPAGDDATKVAAANALATAAQNATAAANAVTLEGARATSEQLAGTGLGTVSSALAQALEPVRVDTKAESEARTAALGAALTGIDDAMKAIAAPAAVPWKALSDLLWHFDAHAQDRLTATSETKCASYQLGRGLAETYWALDPTKATGSTGWSFLLGTRQPELSRLVGRVSGSMSLYTPPAIDASLEVWKDVAGDPAWRGKDDEAARDTAAQLYAQLRRWYELVVLAQDPTTLVKPRMVVTNWRAIGRTIRMFWFQLLFSLGGLASLTLLLVLLSTGGASTSKTLSAVFATVGLSLATVTGAIKNGAQAMIKRLRQDAYTELIAAAILTAPDPPGLTRRRTRSAMARRTLTTITPR